MSALGQLVVKLSLDHAEYTLGLDRGSQEALKFAQNSQKSFDQAERSAKEFFGNVAAGAAGAITSIIGIDAAITRTKQAIDTLASLNDAAQKTGSSVEDLSRIQKTAKNFGDDFGAIEQSITRLAKGLGSFDDEGNQALRALDAIGVSARDSNGELRKSAEVYIDVAKALQGYSDGAEKTAVVNALFGRSGAELLPMLDNLASGIDDVSGVSAESAKRGDEFNDALARSGAAVDSIFGQLAQNLLPTLLNIADAVGLSSNKMGDFGTESSVVATILKSLVIAGRATADVFSDVGREIGGRVAQLVAIASGDFKGAGIIGQELTKDFVQARVDFDKFVDTIMDGDKKIEASVSDGGLKKTIDFALNMPAAQKEATQSTRQAIDASQAFMDKLKQEADQLGKTSAEIRKMEAAKLGLSDAADPLIDQIEQETAAAKLLEAQLSKVKSITQANMTADEKFSETIAELNDLMALPEGGLSPEVYSRAVQKAQSELESSMKDTKDAGKQAADEWDNIWRTSENTARMAFTAFAAHGTSAINSIGESIKTAIIDTLYQLTVRKWVINIGAAIGMGGSGSATASGGLGLADLASSGMNALSLFKSGFGATNLLSKAGSMLPGSVGSFLGGMGVTGTQAAAEVGASALWGASGASTAATMGSSFAAAAGPMIAIAAVDQITRMLAGDKMLGGTAGKILNYVPVLGPLINGLFGRGPLKQGMTVLKGDIGAGGFESGMLQTRFDAKGGAFRSNKTDFATIDAVTGRVSTDNSKLKSYADQLAGTANEIIGLINDAAKQTSGSLRQIGDDLGLSTNSLDSFSHTIKLVSKAGKGLTEEQIGNEIAAITDEMVRGLLPEIDSLAKKGETALQAVGRLGTEFTALVDAASSVLGKSSSDARDMIRGVSFGDRSGFIDAAGGLDALAQKAGFFAQNFYSDAERLAQSQGRVSEELQSLGLSSDLTKDQFKSLVQSFGQVDGITDDMLQSLLNLAPAFVAVTDAQNQLAEQEKQRIAQERFGLETQLLQLQGNTVELRRRELDALDPVNRALQENIFALMDQKTAADEATAAVKNNLSGAFSALQKSVDIERNRITEEYNAAVKESEARINGVTNSIGKLKSLSDALKSTIDKILPIDRSQAKRQIQDAINAARSGGGLPDASALSNALGVLGDSKSITGARSSFEFAREQAKTANLIAELGGLADSQLTLEERSLAALQAQRGSLDEGFKAQINNLDSLLEQGRSQIDVLNGINTSVLSLADALLSFNATSRAAGGANIGVTKSGISYGDIRGFAAAHTPDESYAASMQYGISEADIAASGAYTPGEIDSYLRAKGLPRFAMGGMHRGGLRIVGERGPEIESTGPSRITSNSELAELLGNKDLVVQVSNLIAEMKQSTKFNERVANKLDSVTAGGTSIRVRGL